MSALVLNFGGQRDAVYAAAKQLVRSRALRILVLPKMREAELDYQASDAGLNEVMESLSNGAIGSVHFHGSGSGTFFGGIDSPRFAGEMLEHWSGFVEGSEIEDSAFDDLCPIEGLRYIALSLEESPDFEVAQVTPETFPWDDWHLIAGAVRGDEGQWLMRRK